MKKGTARQQLTVAHNRELAEIFSRMADCYRFLGPDERFRAQAYRIASRTMSNLSEPIDVYHHDLKKLDELKGVGESIALKIEEYLNTGRIATFDQLQKKVPFALLSLMDIEGIGPATIRLLHQSLGVTSPAEVAAAIEQGQIWQVKGLSATMISKLSKALKLEKKESGRIPLSRASTIGKKLVNSLQQLPGVIQVMIAGSIRRQRSTIGDIDIVMAVGLKHRAALMKSIRLLPQVERILSAGKTRISMILQEGIQADLRMVAPYEWGSALLYFTGSKEHNIRLRTLARNKGWKMNEYGIFELRSGKRLAGETEEGIYRIFDLPFIPPEKRAGGKELKVDGDKAD